MLKTDAPAEAVVIFAARLPVVESIPAVPITGISANFPVISVANGSPAAMANELASTRKTHIPNVPETYSTIANNGMCVASDTPDSNVRFVLASAAPETLGLVAINTNRVAASIRACASEESSDIMLLDRSLPRFY